MSVVRLVRGTNFVVDQSVTATGGAVVPDWSTTELTFILDGPNGVRIEYLWRPSGTSSPYISYVALTNTITLTLDATYTATTLTRGFWTLSPLFLTHNTTQLYIGSLQINVVDLPGGAAPVDE